LAIQCQHKTPVKANANLDNFMKKLTFNTGRRKIGMILLAACIGSRLLGREREGGLQARQAPDCG
jgi:hypothetical protein